MSDLSERLNELLIERKLEPKAFAPIIGADLSSLYCWLRGEYSPDFENLVLIADYFGCSLEFLVGRKDEEADFKALSDRKPFPQNLNEIMIDAGVTEYRITKDAGLTRAMVHNWRTGNGFPKLASLIVLADYLGVSLDRLVGRE